jgi:outer membrane protein assembly factor BamC
MNSRLSGLATFLLAIALAGCSVLPDSRKIEYKSAGKAPSLDIPPDLSQITRDDRYVVPDAAGKGAQPSLLTVLIGRLRHRRKIL